MRPRSSVPSPERQAGSRLAQLAHGGELVRGCLTRMVRVCGKPGCRCARGEKHESWYLAYSEGGRKRMVSVPWAWLDRVREWVARHQEAKGCLEALSQACLRRLRERGED